MNSLTILERVEGSSNLVYVELDGQRFIVAIASCREEIPVLMTLFGMVVFEPPPPPTAQPLQPNTRQEAPMSKSKRRQKPAPHKPRVSKPLPPEQPLEGNDGSPEKDLPAPEPQPTIPAPEPVPTTTPEPAKE